MLIRLPRKTTFFDYREVVPESYRDMHIGKDGKLDEKGSVIGYKSVAVPGTVAVGIGAEKLRNDETRGRDGAGDLACRRRFRDQRKIGAGMAEHRPELNNLQQPRIF